MKKPSMLVWLSLWLSIRMWIFTLLTIISIFSLFKGGDIIGSILPIVICVPISIFMIVNRIRTSNLLIYGTKIDVLLRTVRLARHDTGSGTYKSTKGEDVRIYHQYFLRVKENSNLVPIIIGGEENKKFSIPDTLATGLYFDNTNERWKVRPIWAIITIIINTIMIPLITLMIFVK